MPEIIKMFSDGGSRNNPGPAAIGVYIPTLDKKYAEYIGEETNNVAEYAALIFGLKKIKSLVGKEKTKKTTVECYLDSELVVKQLNHQYKIKEDYIKDCFITIWNLQIDFQKVTFHHIMREENKIADALVNQALDEKEKQGSLL
jgi:ribonuclease HI